MTEAEFCEQLRAAVLKLEEERNELTHKIIVFWSDLQMTCPHERLLSAPHKNGILFDFKPLHVCKLCGLTEETWGPQVLRSKDVVEVDRDQVHVFQRGPAHERIGYTKEEQRASINKGLRITP